MVSLEVLDTVLQFAVHGLVKIFDDFGARRFGSRVVCLHILNENVRLCVSEPNSAGLDRPGRAELTMIQAFSRCN